MKRIGSALLDALVYAVIAVLIFFVAGGIWQRFQQPARYTGIANVGYAVVVSGSMEPVFNIGDMIIYHAHQSRDYREGDIIVYTRQESDGSTVLITHRIIEIDGETLTTKGDANEVADAPITWDHVIGKVVFRIPYVGKAADLIRTPAGMGVTCGLIAALAGAGIFFSVRRNKKEKDADAGTETWAEASAQEKIGMAEAAAETAEQVMPEAEEITEND